MNADRALDRPTFLATRADPIRVTGNQPLALDDPAACLLVQQGEVEVFLVERQTDGTPGTRQHLFSVGPGQLLFGIDTAAGLMDMGLLATGTPDTVVRPLDRVALLTADAAEVVTAVEAWVTRLSVAITGPMVPRPRADLALVPGEDVVAGSPRRVGAGQGVAWCRTDADGALYVDIETVPATSAFLPLTRDSWLALPQGVGITSMTTVAMLRSGGMAAALDRFHALAVDVLPMALRLAAVDEVNRLRARGEGNRRAAGRALDVLAGIFAHRPDPVTALDSDQPLVRAMARLGVVMDFRLTLPETRGDEIRPYAFEEITRASRLRSRPLRLEPGWWRADSGAFLLLRQGDARPLALWPVAGTYRLYDPVENVERRLDKAEAAGLAGTAQALYPPLEDRPLRVGDILAGALRARLPDLGTLAGATLLVGLLTLAVPIATSLVLDSVLPDHALDKLWEVAAALLLVAFMTLVLRIAAQFASLRMEGLAGSRLQASVMDRLLRLPARFFRRFTAGELGTRAMAVERLENALTAAMIGSVMTGAVALVSYGLMLAYSWRLGLVAIILTLGLAAATSLFGLLRVRREAEMVAQDARMVGLSLELAGGITKLRLAAAEDRAFLRWARLYADTTHSWLRADGMAARQKAFTAGYTAFATAIILLACMGWDLADGLTLGLLVAFLSAFNAALGGLATLADTAVEMVALAPIARHAAPILEAVPETDRAKVDPGPLSGAVEISRLKFQYQPDTPLVFNDLSLRVEPGEFVALVGPSGTGKSTLFRLLLGFEQPTAGMVLYDGVDLNGLDLQAVRRQCGVVLQNGRLMPGTVLDNILGASLHLGEEAAWEAARQASIADDILRMPMGMRTQVTDGGSAFSGGQVQRILLARAIVGQPRILLLDEATSALDNRTQAVVTDSLNHLAATRLVIAHRLSTVERADRIIVLDKGMVAEEGSFTDLMGRGGLFAGLARRQLTASSRD
ncbi:NHLP bacteriocin export ABC transporter permease/ATPase subunit [Niveispirillum sp.]|uniref:NHLP bacteriocin export ABC transporter permease/ATPase subunit n=1 Tax=Niveispirillum sp. TaxID=1917217 RepID=UPI001B404419|nr:NHLP bacteriocin export ABC transporter permease/ATPase subunit [Niveispirillum sp.]MBP7340429.1 NHLP bacteriocin export ABC transporter permease/ATPase subunit [Niveispirillum sp.]